VTRWLALVSTFTVVVCAFVFSLLNRASAHLDFGVFATDLPVGVMALSSVLVGALLAGIALLLGVVLPLRLRIRRLQRELKARPEQA